MLDILRKGAQSWGIKILFGIIIAVFVLAFGVDRSQTNRGATIGSVKDAPILLTNYQEKLQRSIDMARSQNPNLTAEMLAQMGIKKQVFDQMVTEELLMQKANEAGLFVSKEELANEIHLIPAFHNQSGIFDPEIYKKTLQDNRLTPGSFESEFMRSMLMNKLTSYISANGKLDLEQVQDVFTYGRTKSTVSHVLYKWADYTTDINISEEQISTKYEESKNEYLVPAQSKLSYITLTSGTLADHNAVSGKEIEEYYHANIERFKFEEQVNARHLLIRVDDNASEEEVAKAMEKISSAQQELSAGKSFEEVAEKYTEDPSGMQTGGNLGWFSRGRMVAPFEEAAFTTEPGHVSDPVRTQFGIHLVKVEDKKGAGYEEYKDVIPTILDAIARDRAAEKIQDFLDQALELVTAGGDVNDVAKSIGLRVTVKDTELFNTDRGPTEFEGISRTDLTAINGLELNATIQTPIRIKDGYLFVTKTEHVEPTIRGLEEVRPEIIEKLTRDEARNIARSMAEEGLSHLASNQDVPQNTNATLVETEPFGRQDAIPGLGMNQLASAAIFSASPETWLAESYEFPEGFALIKVATMIPPTNEEWEEEKEAWTTALNQRSEQQLVQAFIAELRAKANIKITNQSLLTN